MRVDRPIEAKRVVERSRFHALLLPVAGVEAMNDVVRARRGEYRKANHHCWACRVLDAGGRVCEASRDDGEVGHPGRVLLEVLRKHDLEGAIVVSRVFGGVKLGVGGVSRAFREVAEDAVAGLLEKRRPRESRPAGG
jgi:putative IMPACT (imprinted ancient) family translation regulator